MPPDRRHLVIFLILLHFSTFTEARIRSRWSCRHHYLAGIRRDAVLPIRGGVSPLSSNVQCHISDDVVVTEVHSALDRPHFIRGKRSVNFQIADLSHLRDIVRRSDCSQTLTVVWKNPPQGDNGAFTIVSLLNESMRIFYEPHAEVQKVELTGTMAGVRHILPDEDDLQEAATVSASSLMCRHEPQKECLVRGKIEIDFSASLPWSYRFAFRTDLSNHTLVVVRSKDDSIHVRLENDFFIRIDSSPPVPVSHLSDANWHTVIVTSSNGRLILTIDNFDNIELTGPVAQDFDSSKTLEIAVEGEVQLIDAIDGQSSEYTQPDCILTYNHRRRLHESVTSHPMCRGCGCPILAEHFDNLPSAACATSDDDAYSLQRDPDRLSFLHIPDAFDIDGAGTAVVRVSTAFKSDSDTGLVLFGYWQTAKLKGRLQVFYHFDRLTSVYCTHNGEEACVGCSIKDSRGFGIDEWRRVALWGAGDELFAAVDGDICRLEPIVRSNNISLAEVYSVPAFVHGNGLFVGGTFYEKKRRGLYRSDVEHKFFENTREKAPSLRGCIKDVFVHGQRRDLVSIHEQQKKEMLNEPSDANAFAVKFGCGRCDPSCPTSSRCRSRSPLRTSHLVCDCADVNLFNSSDGTCQEKRDDAPIVLSTAFLAPGKVVLPIDNTKAILSKVWIKFAAPNQLADDVTIAEFNSHRETLFKIVLDTNGVVHIQNSHDFDGGASAKLDLADDRVHLLVLQRRTPLGTRNSAKKFDLWVDGAHDVVADLTRLSLNNISVTTPETSSEKESVIIHDFGIGYDFDEHAYLLHPSNAVHQVDVHALLLPYQTRNPQLDLCGQLDPALWQRPIDTSFESTASDPTSPSTADQMAASPHGDVVGYTPDAYEPEQLLSARWLLYSIILTILLCLLILVCITCYWCVIRKRGRKRSGSGSDRATIMRDSPDYQPVILRKNSFDSGSIGDGSLGTDDTDLQAYRDIPSHRVKIYRESMVSILVPSVDQAGEAAIVKRSSVNEEDVPLRPTPSPDSPAPLVNVNDD